jgi:protein-tyrosine phosphatase
MVINRILLICSANICRSPMAEAVFRQLAGLRRVPLAVSSAGIHALVGQGIAADAQAALQRRGLDLAAHRARQLDQAMLREADLVLVMETEQRAALRALSPTHAGKVLLLGHWSGAEVQDPFRCGIDAFERALDLIEQSVGPWLERLA